MFRKSYKNAIDCVGTNEELKSLLLKKAENAEKTGEAVKAEKSKEYKQGIFPKIRIYTLSGLATAAVLLLALNNFDTNKSVNQSIIQPSDYIQTEKKNSESKEKAENILPSESKSVADSADEKKAESEKKENDEKDKAPQNEKSENTAFEKNESVTPENQSEKAEGTEKSKSAKEAEELKTEEDGSTSEKAEKAENMPETISNDDDEVQVYNNESENQGGLRSSSTAGSYSMRSLPNMLTEEWSKEKYCEYIGIDIEKTAKIPDDMQNQTEKTVYIAKDENGDIINDYFNFIFSGENERYINISTEKSSEADKDWEKTMLENYISATKRKNGTQINVEGYMLTEEEQNALLNSLN